MAVHPDRVTIATGQVTGHDRQEGKVCNTLLLLLLAHYNFDADRPILIIFVRDVAERVCCQTVICYPTSPN